MTIKMEAFFSVMKVSYYRERAGRGCQNASRKSPPPPTLNSCFGGYIKMVLGTFFEF